jgi:hypothetical protein
MKNELTTPLAVVGVVPPKARAVLCAVSAADLDRPFSYRLTMQAVPADPEPERVSELDGRCERGGSAKHGWAALTPRMQACRC